MKSHFIPLILVIVSFVVTIHFIPAYSDFSSDKKYLIQAAGYLTGTQDISDATLTLQLDSGALVGSNLFATLDNGIITIGDNSYTNSGTWQSTFLRNGKYLSINGDAQDLNGNIIHINLFGRMVYSKQDGAIYSFTGKIAGTETMKAVFSAKISEIVSSNSSQQATTLQQTQPQNQQQTQLQITQENQTSGIPSKTQSPKTNLTVQKIMLVTRQSSPVSIAYTYSINLKVFDSSQNPSASFDKFNGVIPNANITGQILDSNNNVIKSFGGLTDKGGYYSYSFRIPDNFVPGTYTVNVKAQIGSLLDNKTLTLFVRPYNN